MDKSDRVQVKQCLHVTKIYLELLVIASFITKQLHDSLILVQADLLKFIIDGDTG